MSAATVGVLGFIFMLILIAFRVPIYVAMCVSGFLGILIIKKGNMSMVETQFMNAPFSQAASYTFALLPMFMLMGVMTEETGIAEGTFDACMKWLGRQRGGLLSTVIVANAVFGACSGSPTAGGVVFARLAMPSLDKAGYDRGNALACISTASNLASLIPPSVSIIMSCIITELSITRGLLCGIGAGILTTVIMLVVNQLVGIVSPGKIPPPDKTKIPMKEKLKSLRLLIPILVLFVIIIGGAAAGFFSATVGGAMGALVTIIYALCKKMPIKRIFDAAVDSCLINCSVFPMLLGGIVFGRFITLSKLPQAFIALIQTVNASRVVVFTIVVIFYLICGCLMDMLSIILITVPIVFPMLQEMGFEPYALLILLVYVTSIGGITPPIGLSVFVTANAVDVDPAVIFKGIIPYFIALLLSLYLVAFVPQIILFIPNLFV